jgi:hypothetical protein
MERISIVGNGVPNLVLFSADVLDVRGVRTSRLSRRRETLGVDR